MKFFKQFLVIVLILLFFAFLGLIRDKNNALTQSTDKLFYNFELEKKYETKVNIIEKNNNSELFLGFTSDNLEFGIIPLESVSKRFLNLTNDNEENYKILLMAIGNISPMVKFSKNDFSLSENETTSVTVFLDSSLASNTGNYTGEIYVISKKPKFSFLNNMEDL